MTNELFPKHNQLPQILQDVIKQSGLESMEPGETTWVVPWALEVDENGLIHINNSVGERDQKRPRPGRTARLKVVSDFEGLYMDATALNKDDIQKHFVHKPENSRPGVSKDDIKPVNGVLYPLIIDKAGFEPKAVEAFNEEQQELRVRFGEYYEDTYGSAYTFAHDEVITRSAQQAVKQGLGAVATRKS